jgi:hypothetical protein
VKRRSNAPRKYHQLDLNDQSLMQTIALMYGLPSHYRIRSKDHQFLCHTDHLHRRKDTEQWVQRRARNKHVFAHHFHDPTSCTSSSSSSTSASCFIHSSLAAPRMTEDSWLCDVQLAALLPLFTDPLLNDLSILVHIHPMATTLFMDSIKEKRLRRLRENNIENKYTLCPISGNGHWRLIIIDGVHHVIYLFDSLGASFHTSEESTLRKCFETYSVETVVHETFQVDGYNCGIWIVLFAKVFIQWALDSESTDSTSRSIFIWTTVLASLYSINAIKDLRRECVELFNKKA